MKKVVLSMLVSLDGQTARADGSLDWFLNDGEFETYSLNMLRSVGAILVGRVTYQMFSEYWPKAGTEHAELPPGEGFTSAEREREMAELMNTLPKILLGSGIPLFENHGADRKLVRTDAKVFRSGVVAVHYDRAR
ncbi:MAG TPA: dihydrofolate reductase family protein [Polyangiaceae bacterium]|nr:dihydrofolate reductase family protein [Polyangiaceae bacterium]